MVDPETRHGHHTAARGFDGYKGHVAIDPDSEIVTATEVTAGNVADGAVAPMLLEEELATTAVPSPEATPPPQAGPAPLEAYGDCSYGTGENLELVEAAGREANFKVQPVVNRDGKFSKSEFQIDLENQVVTCPNGKQAPIRRHGDGSGEADFGARCASCA